MLILTPCGRFGNNIVQLINAINIALFNNINIIRYNFRHFVQNEIILQESQLEVSKPGDMDYHMNCFYILEIQKTFPNMSLSLLNLRFIDKQKLALTYILPIIKYINMPDFDYDHTLFIHIRSGDTFNINPHSAYIPPPADYYIKIIKILPDNFKIFVIYEDDKNPCVNILKNTVPNIQLLCLPIDQTIGIFINAKYVVVGPGTFIPSILIMNKDVKKIFHCGIFSEETDRSMFIQAALPNYIKEWKNTKEQCDLIINYNETVLPACTG